MTRVNGTDRVLTGWGRTAPRRAYVAGPMETSRSSRPSRPAVSWPGGGVQLRRRRPERRRLHPGAGDRPRVEVDAERS